MNAIPAWAVGWESGFPIKDFRPLVVRSQEHDIGMFLHHLNREGADA